MCDKHGNGFIDFKCTFCCSIALFFCGGNRYFCTPCHNDAMNGGKAKAKSKCTGGKNCPLGIPEHPKAGSNFVIGCSLCRSNNLDFLEERKDAQSGINLEARADMIKRFDHVKGRELKFENENKVLKDDDKKKREKFRA